MENNFIVIGQYVCIVGGFLISLIATGFFAYFAVTIWIAFSNKFRTICKAESLIFEYKKEKDEYLEWKKERSGNSTTV